MGYYDANPNAALADKRGRFKSKSAPAVELESYKSWTHVSLKVVERESGFGIVTNYADWVEENCEGRTRGSLGYLSFELESDAILFSLTFGN